jgi:hypothetical protein
MRGTAPAVLDLEKAWSCGVRNEGWLLEYLQMALALGAADTLRAHHERRESRELCILAMQVRSRLAPLYARGASEALRDLEERARLVAGMGPSPERLSGLQRSLVRACESLYILTAQVDTVCSRYTPSV